MAVVCVCVCPCVCYMIFPIYVYVSEGGGDASGVRSWLLLFGKAEFMSSELQMSLSV